MIVWLIGLSGSGKTTVGTLLVEKWKQTEPQTVLVDGDQIRDLFKFDQRAASHTIEGRRINAERMTSICHWLDQQGINVVCSILSIFPDMRAENRKVFANYFEVYLSVPMSVLTARDTKGLYAAAKSGEMDNVVGVDIEFPEPLDANLIVNSHGEEQTPELIAEQILKSIQNETPK